jgi:aspartate aminotransferase
MTTPILTTTHTEARRAADFFPAAGTIGEVEAKGLSSLARGLVGSEVLKIAGEVRSVRESGKAVCDLTVGDFSSKEFPIPEELLTGIVEALNAGETNYPPSDGTKELRLAVQSFFESELGLTYPIESILIAGGSRPLIYATFLAIVDKGDKVLYPVPSWNNNHYTFLAGGEAVEMVVDASTNFFPTAERIRPLLAGVRLLSLNTPLNPTGTVMPESEVRAIAQLVVDENDRRKITGERALYLMWDQVYWMLTFGDNRHATPPALVPEAAAWTIFVDGVSKAFAATGIRVGWTVAPPYVTSRMRDLLGHIGAWAPRAEQMAVARFLGQRDAITSFHQQMTRSLRRRLGMLHEGFDEMRKDGLPVEAFSPQGAIYLSVRFALNGRRFGGKTIETNEQIRRLLLEEAGFAVVPFQAFGLKEETGWFRLSAGAVSTEQIAEGLARVKQVLEKVE